MVKIHLVNQDLLAQKLTFFLFLEDNMCIVVWSAYVFTLSNKKNISHILDTLHALVS